MWIVEGEVVVVVCYIILVVLVELVGDGWFVECLED